MSTNFPTTLDQYAAVPTNQALVVRHQDRHQNIEDAMEAVEAKIGVNNSTDPNSIDFRLNALEVLGPGLGFVSVKFLGAKGDGVTDDYAKLQAAIDSGFDALYWPPGTYMLSQRLKPASNQYWEGSPGQVVITMLAGAASNAPVVMRNADGLEGSLDNWHASGLIFDGAAKDTGFLVYGCNNVSFTDCVFRNCGTYGAGFQSRPGFTITLPQDNIHMLRCRFENNGSDAPGWDGLDVKWCTNSKFIDCEATGNTDAGLNFRGRNVDLIGCSATGNGTAGILLQSNDATEDSQINLIGGKASGTTAGPGLEIQGNTGRNTYINVDGFQAYSNTGDGLRISGSGKVIGTINGFQSRSNTADGVNVGGDFVGSLRFNGGLITSNGGDGFDNTGKNCVLDGVNILSNTGTGYIERAGADNNYVLPNCVISGNGTDIGARVGVETDDGFASVRSKNAIRLFPGTAQGLEMRTDAGGTWGAVVAVGDAASIDLRLISKGNGDVGIFNSDGSRQLGLFREAGTNIVNFIDFVASLTTTPVIVQASGTDANIDLQLNPKGTGNVRFGTFTVNADAPVTGYITVKDAAGNARKLAVIA